MDDVEYTVGEVAARFGVTVRTLHHYDAIGLLIPSGRTRSGYRTYDAGDLTRLQNIVVYRRLGFPLGEIGQMLAADADLESHLRRQRLAVTTRLEELHDLVAALDRTLENVMNDRPATSQDLKELFGDGYDEGYQVEAEQRWGDTVAWRQSQERTAGYTKADWAAVKAETDAVNQAFVSAMKAGQPATSPVAMDAAEAHRRQIDERFYQLGYPMHRGLADMYLADPRFTATYEAIQPGLAQYVHDAIHANADRQSVGGAG
jgi:MerR family transcriptional regulator, thiopeptide resistance regulator